MDATHYDEVCNKCGRKINRQEIAHVYKDRVFCDACINRMKRLSGRAKYIEPHRAPSTNPVSVRRVTPPTPVIPERRNQWLHKFITKPWISTIVIIWLCAAVIMAVTKAIKEASTNNRFSSTSTPLNRSQAQQPDKEMADKLDNIPQVPSDVNYSIITDTATFGVKRSIDVRLNKPVSEGVLRAIALNLKAQTPNQYNLTFILYYLPNMTPGSGAWASTHFDPELEVKILGFASEDLERVMNLSPSGTVSYGWQGSPTRPT